MREDVVCGLQRGSSDHYGRQGWNKPFQARRARNGCNVEAGTGGQRRGHQRFVKPETDGFRCEKNLPEDIGGTLEETARGKLPGKSDKDIGREEDNLFR